VLARLKDFGTVRSQNVDSEDVTKAYVDLETRLKSKEILAERLRKLLSEGKGNVKELMEVEVQLGATNEAIEQIKGEIKYYDNLVGLSTITLQLSEKDLGQPFEYVQSLQSNIAVTAKDPDDAYAKAQKEIIDAGGQVVDSRMTRQNDGSSTGTIRGRVDAEKFPALREALKRLGTVTNDTVNQQKTARGGQEGIAKPDAPLRKELAVVDVAVNSPPIFVTRRFQILVETEAVDSAYQNARRAVEGAGGKVVDGSLTGSATGKSATLKAQIDADKFGALVDSLKTAGKVKNENVSQSLPPVSPEGGPQLLRERAEIELALVSPPQLIGEEHGIVRMIRDTFANSWAGFLWSMEKLFVGISLAGPWIVVLLGAWLLWRRARKKKATQPTT
jgi:glycine cleavage system regulatory protein